MDIFGKHYFGTKTVALHSSLHISTELNHCGGGPVFAVKVSRPYFSTSPQAAREKFGLGTRLDGARLESFPYFRFRTSVSALWRFHY